MEALKRTKEELLTGELTITQMGLMLTALLCKDKTKELSEVRFKHFVKIADNWKDLLILHEKGYIKWSKYNYYKKKERLEKTDPKVVEIITFMNDLYGRRFDPKASTSNNLKNRLKDYSIEQIKLVIANRYEEWKDDKVMNKYLNPVTIFRESHFEKYLEEAERTKVGSGIISVSKLNLNTGDELTFNISSSLVDSDLYDFKVFRADSKGNKKGNGVLHTKNGKGLKVLLNVQKNTINSGGKKEFIYIFEKR